MTVARRPAIGGGLAAYVALMWGTAAASLLVPRSPLVFAGMVTLRLDALERALEPVADALPHLAGRANLESMLPFAFATIVLSGSTAAVAVRLGISWGASVIAATGGPALAAATYWLNVDLLYLYNLDAFQLVHVTALFGLLVAALTATAARIVARSQPSQETPQRATPTAG